MIDTIAVLGYTGLGAVIGFAVVGAMGGIVKAARSAISSKQDQEDAARLNYWHLVDKYNEAADAFYRLPTPANRRALLDVYQARKEAFRVAYDQPN